MGGHTSGHYVRADERHHQPCEICGHPFDAHEFIGPSEPSGRDQAISLLLARALWAGEHDMSELSLNLTEGARKLRDGEAGGWIECPEPDCYCFGMWLLGDNDGPSAGNAGSN